MACLAEQVYTEFGSRVAESLFWAAVAHLQGQPVEPNLAELRRTESLIHCALNETAPCPGAPGVDAAITALSAPSRRDISLIGRLWLNFWIAIDEHSPADFDGVVFWRDSVNPERDKALH